MHITPKTEKPISTLILQSILLWGIGMYLRLPILIIPPLTPELTASLHLNATQLNIILTLPLLLLAGGALLSERIVEFLAPRPAIYWGLFIVGAGSCARAFSMSFVLMILWTTVLGLGIALLQVALPVYLRSQQTLNIARATAIYTNGLLVGEVLVTSTTPLLAASLHDLWPLSFIIWTIPLILFVFLFFISPNSRHKSGCSEGFNNRPQQSLSRIIIRMGLIIGGSATMYFSTNAFLPQILALNHQKQLIAPMLAALNGTQLLASVWLIWLGTKALTQKKYFIAFAITACIGVGGLIFIPISIHWTIALLAGLCGFGTAGMLTTVLSKVTHFGTPSQSRKVVSGTLFLGYLMAFAIPALGGKLADLTQHPETELYPSLLFGCLSFLLILFEKDILPAPPKRNLSIDSE